MKKKIKIEKLSFWQIIILITIIAIGSYGYVSRNLKVVQDNEQKENKQVVQTAEDKTPVTSAEANDLSSIPAYEGTPYIEINSNNPYFTEENYTTEEFETYSELDSLGRSGVAYANICKNIMPKEGEERGEISSVKNLTGWVQKRYDNLIKDKYLYNRCHLIGWQLAGENANKKNLITGTRYLNTEGMLPFENKVADYIKENEKNHVLYRVTPIFKGNNLLADGVEMEAWSVEDEGNGVHFNIYCYNVQPGIAIDYATGESQAE